MGVEALIEQFKDDSRLATGQKSTTSPVGDAIDESFGVMSGYSSLRGLEDFMQRHQHEAVA